MEIILTTSEILLLVKFGFHEINGNHKEILFY